MNINFQSVNYNADNKLINLQKKELKNQSVLFKYY